MTNYPTGKASSGSFSPWTHLGPALCSAGTRQASWVWPREDFLPPWKGSSPEASLRLTASPPWRTRPKLPLPTSPQNTGTIESTPTSNSRE